MKASEIELDVKETIIQIPNCDASQVIYNMFGLQQFIGAFGDVDVVLDRKTDAVQWFSVPSFLESRNKFCSQKSLECEKWGSE